MGKFKDLTGQKFGRLTVIERAENDKSGNVRWRCRCECGNFCVVAGGKLTSEHTQSCGCLKREPSYNFQDLTGKIFGKLTVLERVKNKGEKVCWRCRCKCGNTCIVQGNSLKNGDTQSCGCLRHKSPPNKTHGMKGTNVYGVWSSIKTRCFNPKRKAYKNYGGRGITMYPAWVNDFQAFYNYVSQLPHFGEEGYTLDRIDNDGNYEPNNLRWTDRKTQARNRRNNSFIEYKGKPITLAEAAEKSRVNTATLRNRIKHGETGEYLLRLPK